MEREEVFDEDYLYFYETWLTDERSDQEAQLVWAVEYVEGDMRELPWNDRFDAVLSWFTSFGYFDDDDNRRVLREAHKALRPGGTLLIDINNLLGFRRALPTGSVLQAFAMCARARATARS